MDVLHDFSLVGHIPGVGSNLQDHLEVYVANKCKKPLTLLKYQKGFPMIWSGIQWFAKKVRFFN